jgi:hypothetical protein
MYETDAHNPETALIAQEPKPMAWDKQGQRFVVPRRAHQWRVQRKPDGRGRPSAIFTPTGVLHIDIDASFEDLGEAVRYRTGWYVLTAVDQLGVILTDCPQAYVKVVAEAGSAAETRPGRDNNETVSRLCTTVEQFLHYSAQRDEAICGALGQMTAAFSDIQRSTAEMIRSSANGMDIAAGVSLQKLPPPPTPPELPPPPPQKTVMDFLVSPAGHTAVGAISNLVGSLAKKTEES